MKAPEISSDLDSETIFQKANEKMTLLLEGFSPAGLKVLVVDDDPVCLMILETMLRQCNYTVTTCQRAAKALALLRENKHAFDLVMSDVYMPDMDGFKLLEAIGLELDLPVIMMSANGETDVVMKGITHGACDYLLKPVRIEELRNIWQHVIRRRGRGECMKDEQAGDWDDTVKGFDSPSEGESNSKKRKEKQEPADEPPEDVNSLKKARVVWSVELHQQFVNAVNQLGIDKAVPKRILEIMNVQGLSRENVASHLQKYRQYLKRLSGVCTQPYPVASFQAAQAGNFGGSMQIQPGGRGVAAASGKGLTVPIRVSNVGGLPRDLGQINSATLSTLAKLHAHQQTHAGLMSSQILGGLNQLNVALKSPPRVPFAGLQKMSSVELDMLMTAAQQDSYLRQKEAGNTQEMVGLRGPCSNIPCPSMTVLGDFKREDELNTISGLGLNHVFDGDKFAVESEASYPESARSKKAAFEGNINVGVIDGALDAVVTTSSSDFSASFLSQIFPPQQDEGYRSELGQ